MQTQLLPEREIMHYDVVIVGAGPAGLATAIRLKQIAASNNQTINICVLEKAASVGAHSLSGAVMDPRGLDELMPNWRALNIPTVTPVTEDQFLFLSSKKAFKLPTPPLMQNHGNVILSLGALCRFLSAEAEQLGVEIYPGFAGSEVIYDDQDRVVGIATGDVGIQKNGEHGAQFQRGMALHAEQIIIAEGCRGSLSRQLIEKFKLNENADPQTFGLGIKELWQVTPEQHHPGRVIHTVGWPLDQKTYGGSFIYHLAENYQVAVGFVVGLDYQNPTLSPFEEMQRFKTHPAIKPIFSGGKRIAYGARALVEGGYQSLPKLSFPGGVLIGDAAGLVNVAKIKGTHNAIKSGILAAEYTFQMIKISEKTRVNFTDSVKNSWIGEELYRVRNVRPSFKYGLIAGLGYSAFDQLILRGKAPWTFHHHADHLSLQKISACQTITYPKPDGAITFDRLSSVFLTGVQHNEDQPSHLRLSDPVRAIEINYKIYGGPEARYCPAGVYEFVGQGENVKLQINAANCIHCKTCDIKDPTQNITWVPPEGGGGPNYSEM